MNEGTLGSIMANKKSSLRYSENVCLSAISIGELLAGFKIRKEQSEQVSQFEEFLDSPRVELCSVTYSTADFYSEIYLKLRKAGTPIPTNDIWIAATALEHGFRIFTLDEHFQDIAGMTFF